MTLIQIITRTGLHCTYMAADRVPGYLRRNPHLTVGAERRKA